MSNSAPICPVGLFHPNARWMEDHDSLLWDKKWCEVVLPGTHNSGTEPLSTTGRIIDDGNPDAWVLALQNNKLPNIGIIITLAIARKVTCLFSRDQGLTISDQLESGIRYLDLRVYNSTTGTKGFYLVHSMKGASVQDALDQVHGFLSAHANEFVILDFNHFYNMTEATHTELAEMIQNTLGSTALFVKSTTSNPPIQTIGELTTGTTARAIVLYDSDGGVALPVIQNNDFLYQHDLFLDTWWPNKQSEEDAMAYLAGILSSSQYRFGSEFQVLQPLLTPNTKTIVNHFIPNEGYASQIEWAKDYTPSLLDSVQALNLDYNVLLVDSAENSNVVDLCIFQNGGENRVTVPVQNMKGQKHRVSNNFAINFPGQDIQFNICGVPDAFVPCLEWDIYEDKNNKKDKERLGNVVNGTIAPGVLTTINPSKMYIAYLRLTWNGKTYTHAEVFPVMGISTFYIRIVVSAPPSE